MAGAVSGLGQRVAVERVLRELYNWKGCDSFLEAAVLQPRYV